MFLFIFFVFLVIFFSFFLGAIGESLVIGGVAAGISTLAISEIQKIVNDDDDTADGDSGDWGNLVVAYGFLKCFEQLWDRLLFACCEYNCCKRKRH